jgi:hypothetical protein
MQTMSWPVVNIRVCAAAGLRDGLIGADIDGSIMSSDARILNDA